MAWRRASRLRARSGSNSKYAVPHLLQAHSRVLFTVYVPEDKRPKPFHTTRLPTPPGQRLCLSRERGHVRTNSPSDAVTESPGTRFSPGYALTSLCAKGEPGDLPPKMA